jgi:hypothetical protein
MATPMEILMQSVIPNRTPPGGAAVAPRIMPAMAPQAIAPMAASAEPQLSPTAKYIQDMQALMSGGIGRLSTGEKITALGQVLQAAGSRGAADPSAVLQNVRNQQMEKLNAQLKIAQLQQSAQQEAQQRAFVKQYASALPEEKRGVLENADPAEAFKIVQEEAFRQKQVFNRDRDPATGNIRLTFNDGSFVITDQKMPPKTREIDAGDAVEIYNEDTNELIMSVPKRMNAYQRESLGLRRQEMARADARAREGGGGSGGTFSLQRTEDGRIIGINTKNPRIQIDTGQRAPAPANPYGFAGVLPPATGKPVFVTKK